jgi:hypothetical protein
MLDKFQSLPLWVRKFIVDFGEGAVSAVLVLNIAIPSTLGEAKAQAVIVGAAVAGALVAAVRRAAPDVLAYLRSKLGVGSTE